MNALTVSHLLRQHLQGVLSAMPQETPRRPSSSKQHPKPKPHYSGCAADKSCLCLPGLPTAAWPKTG
jgi:hypothetical protein